MTLADAPQLTEAQQVAAQAAGMTPEKYAALQGKTTVGEYQEAAEAERRAREGGES